MEIVVDAHLPAESHACKVAGPAADPSNVGTIALLKLPLLRTVTVHCCGVLPDCVTVIVATFPAVKFAPVTVTLVTPAMIPELGDALTDGAGGGVGVGVGLGLGIGLAIGLGLGARVGVGLGAD